MEIVNKLTTLLYYGGLFMRKLIGILQVLSVLALIISLAAVPPLLDFYLGVVMYIVYGAVARMYLPYLRKIYRGEKLNFKPEYFLSFLASLTMTIPTGIGLLIPFMQLVSDVESKIMILFLAFLYGFGGDAVMKEVLSWFKTINEAKKRGRTI